MPNLRITATYVLAAHPSTSSAEDGTLCIITCPGQTMLFRAVFAGRFRWLTSTCDAVPGTSTRPSTTGTAEGSAAGASTAGSIVAAAAASSLMLAERPSRRRGNVHWPQARQPFSKLFLVAGPTGKRELRRAAHADQLKGHHRPSCANVHVSGWGKAALGFPTAKGLSLPVVQRIVLLESTNGRFALEEIARRTGGDQALSPLHCMHACIVGRLMGVKTIIIEQSVEAGSCHPG